MRKHLLVSLLGAFSAFAQPTISWDNNFGGSHLDYPKSLSKTPDGYLSGGTSRSNDHGVGNHLAEDETTSTDIYIVRTDMSGQMLWQRNYGGSRTESLNVIKPTSDGNFIVAGATSSDDGDVIGGPGEGFFPDHYWIFKISPDGDILWQLTGLVGEIGCSAEDVVEMPDGNLFFVGNCYAVNGTFGYADAFSMVVTADGTLSGTPQILGAAWQHDSLFRAVKTNTGYCAVGSSGLNSLSTETDFWVVLFGPSGEFLSEHLYGGTANDEAKSIVTTADNGLIVVGSTESHDLDVEPGDDTFDLTDVWILKLNEDMEPVWNKRYGGNWYDGANDIIHSASETETFYIAGHTSSTNTGSGVSASNGGWDALVMEISSDGEMQWFKSIGSDAYDNGHSLQLSEDGQIVLLAESSLSGGDVSNNFGFEDFWLVSLNAEELRTSDVLPNKAIVYPNPVRNKLQVLLDPSDEIIAVDIHDISGRNVIHEENKTVIDTDRLQPGVYTVILSTSNGIFNTKILKQ